MARFRCLGFLALALTALSWTFVAPRRAVPRATAVSRRAAMAPAPVKTRPDSPGMPSSPDPRRMGEAVRWMMDEDVEKPPEW